MTAKDREQVLLNYLDALEDGDIDTVSAIMRRAEADPQLVAMILAYHAEEPDAVPELALVLNTNHHKKIKEIQMLIDQQEKPKRKPIMRRTRWIAGLAVSAALILSFFAGMIASRPQLIADILPAQTDDTASELADCEAGDASSTDCEAVVPVITQTPTRTDRVTNQIDCDAADVSRAECEALVTLYTQTNEGQGWRHTDGWMQTNDICDWYGVECRLGRVVVLTLPRNSLQGELPDLSHLADLEELDLSDNLLRGQAMNLSVFTEMQYLDLSDNPLSGVLPDFEQMPDLEYVDLSDWDALTGTLSHDLDAPNLRYMDLSKNALIGRVPNLYQMPMIQHLDLSHNQLTGMVRGIEQAVTLRYLDLSYNQLHRLIPDTSDLPDLQYIDFTRSGLEDR